VVEESYKIEELSRAAGTSARTVRYYVQRGLLPPPAFRGKDSAYGKDHLLRLRAIRRLQEAYYPLDAIAALLADKTLAELEGLLEGEGPVPVRGLAVCPIEPEAPSVLRGRSFERFELAPGVELLVAGDAPAASRQVADAIVRLANETGR
jgi:DNA-binding transcriptional MerR regulator